MMRPRPVITLITDFGTKDEYVGAMKGVILSHCRDTVIVDISHDVPPQDIAAGSRLLARSFGYFPPQTVHLVVVDPGVGTRRPILALAAGGYYFIGPDNGVLTPVIERYPSATVHRVSEEKFFRHPVSNTFHGRDIIAPVAARLATGLAVDEVGPALDRENCILAPAPSPLLGKSTIHGIVTHIDSFSNLITNIARSDIARLAGNGPVVIEIGNTVISGLRSSYGECCQGELLALYDSQDYLEIGVNKGRAAHRLKAHPGATVTVKVI